MTRVKAFKTDDISILEKDINDFITNMTNNIADDKKFSVRNIKFTFNEIHRINQALVIYDITKRDSESKDD